MMLGEAYIGIRLGEEPVNGTGEETGNGTGGRNWEWD